MRVAFVLSGGASLGACQAGMLQALYEEGVCPDLLIGTSAGAINAAFAASRPATVRTAQELQQIWRGLTRSHVFPANPVTAGLGMLGLREHTVSPGSLRRMLSRHLQIEQLRDAPIRGALASAVAALSHALTRRFSEDLFRYANSVELTVLPAPRVEGIMPTDFGHADQLIADGLRLARAVLARSGRVVPLRRAA